jgi:class 3 adenylate cyclase
VNTSARLEAATKEVGTSLLLSQASYDLLPPARQALCVPKGGIRVKGKAEPVDVYAMEQAAPQTLMGSWLELEAAPQA